MSEQWGEAKRSVELDMITIDQFLPRECGGRPRQDRCRRSRAVCHQRHADLLYCDRRISGSSSNSLKDFLRIPSAPTVLPQRSTALGLHICRVLPASGPCSWLNAGQVPRGARFSAADPNSGRKTAAHARRARKPAACPAGKIRQAAGSPLGEGPPCAVLQLAGTGHLTLSVDAPARKSCRVRRR